MLRALWMSFLTFWLGVIIWLGVECNTECRSIYSSECDMPMGAWILGSVFALITFIKVAYDEYWKGS